MMMPGTGNRLNKRTVLVFEWCCGGGLLIDGHRPPATDSLLAQGRQMLTAVCTDLQHAGANILVPVDPRWSLETDAQQMTVTQTDTVEEQLMQMANRVDNVLIIAPESGGRLEQCLDWLRDIRANVLNPTSRFTSLCSDKHRLQNYLAQRNIDVPLGGSVDNLWSLRHSLDQSHGWVIKPRDGCGSEGLEFVRYIDADLPGACQPQTRIEEFVPGTAVSVSAICGRDRVELLPALRQQFDGWPVGRFTGCVDDLPAETAARAQRLAHKVIAVLPKTKGYFGIDMVIGERDVVIEVNPRITMSYPVLREKVDFNMAARMLD